MSLFGLIWMCILALIAMMLLKIVVRAYYRIDPLGYDDENIRSHEDRTE